MDEPLDWRYLLGLVVIAGFFCWLRWLALI